MIDKIRTILIGNSSISDVVGTKVYYVNPPQGVQLPFIIIDVDGGTINNDKSGVSGLDQVDIQITSYCEQLVTEDSIAGAYTLMELVRDVLDYYSGTVSGTALHVRTSTAISTVDISLPNKSMMGASMDFEVYETR